MCQGQACWDNSLLCFCRIPATDPGFAAWLSQGQVEVRQGVGVLKQLSLALAQRRQLLTDGWPHRQCRRNHTLSHESRACARTSSTAAGTAVEARQDALASLFSPAPPASLPLA